MDIFGNNLFSVESGKEYLRYQRKYGDANTKETGNRLFETIKGISERKFDKEDEENVENFMNEAIQESLQKCYSTYIKRGCLGNMAICFLATLTSYLEMNEENEKANTQKCIHAAIFFVISFLVLIICGRKAFYLVYLVPILIGLAIYMAIDITLQSDEYRPSDRLMVSCCVAHCFMILIPNKWIHSSIAHALAMCNLGYGAWKNYGLFTSEINMTIILCVFWFTLSSYFLSLKTKNLYSEIYRNKILIKQTKRILQILLFGVVVWPSKSSQKFFINQEFKDKFTDVDQRLEELSALDLKLLDNKCEVINEEFRNDLSKFLKAQQRLIDTKESVFEQDVKLWCYSQEDFKLSESSEQNSNLRIICIKTLAIEWENSDSYIHVCIDNTDVIRLEEIKSKIKLDEANNSIQCQKIMFASASHEFKNPLNCIINSFNLVQDSFNTIINIYGPSFLRLNNITKEEIESNVRVLTKKVKNGKSSSILLLTLIEDILNLSKMEAGTFEINKELFLVPEVLNEIFDIFSMQCQGRKIELMIDVPSDLKNLEINSDRLRLKQILTNLVSNSLKFTSKGFIRISCKAVKKTPKRFLEFTVRDSGIGIEKKDLKKLFKLYGMIKKTKKINRNGTGLGLTICKKYVESLGGEIQLKSVYGQGTSVGFSVLIGEDEEEVYMNSDKSLCSYFESDLEICDEGYHNQDLSYATQPCSKGKFKDL
ncbi:unnamed protein product [Moneuplotes crassus]|uniref:Histidine kinase domain-containing protein n=1 Tax=Euplotes crassus TaxID=5936 RepID=A0AAD2DAE6_EUPCR|nr:unnamed protein product [Moneuplotes crassus]